MTQMQSRNGTSSKLSSPTSLGHIAEAEQDLDLLKRNLSNHGSASGSDYATDGTDDISTQNNSDPFVASGFDSPTFVLPDIDELYDYQDDQSNISTVSRISAAFVQFSPAIPREQESEFARMGLSTVDAAYVPNYVQCVTSVNFLADVPQETSPPPSQVQVTCMPRKKPTRKKRNSNSQIAFANSLEQTPCMGVPGSDDCSDLFSVRSEPYTRRNSNQFQRAPKHADAAIPRQVTRKASLQGYSRGSAAETPSLKKPPRRISSLPIPTTPEADACDLESLTSEVSRQSRMSTASAPPTFAGGKQHSSKACTPSAQRGPPPTQTGRKATKEKTSVFGKLFSNQVQADFDDDLLAEHARRGLPETSSRQPVPLDYGVEPGADDNRRSMLMKASCDSVRSFGEASLRSGMRQGKRASSRNVTRAAHTDLDDPDHAAFVTECHDSFKKEKGGKSIGQFFRRKSKDVDVSAS